MNTVHNRRYDLSGAEISRLIKIAIFSKIMPMGNFRGGPGGRCLAVLSVLHYLGYPVYRVLAQYGHRLRFLKRIVMKLKG
jgi:hypothetical protein